MGTKLGILGAGQLAKMLVQSAKKYELETIVYAQDLVEPACAYADKLMLGSQDSKTELKEFFNYCDLVLLESEFYSAELLKSLCQETNTKTYPEIEGYEKLATKASQANFFHSLQIDMAPRVLVAKKSDLAKIHFEPPYMLKLSYGGYDGYGNFKVESKKDLEKTLIKISENFNNIVIVEKFLEIKAEYACMLVKGQQNSIILPICKTYQENEVCQLVSYPSDINGFGEKVIESAISKIDNDINAAGVYAFEFFETTTGEFFINEAAPRVHNSYHLSIEGFSRSQFDLLIECALGLKISDIEIRYKYLSMVNILGQNAGEDYNLSFPDIAGEFDFKIHLYGKKQAKPGRKLGHLTLFGATQNLDYAKKINKEYRI